MKSKSQAKRIGFALALIPLLLVRFYPRFSRQRAPAPEAAPARSQATLAAVRPALAPQPPASADPGLDPWKSFSAHFGKDLKISRGSQGQLVAVQGAPGQGGKGSDDYRPSDAKKAIARAQEVLQAAHAMLGLAPESPLAEAIAKTSPVSAQVYFQETIDGVALEPYGSVLVDLGPQGELLGLTSDYVSPLKVINERTLSAEQARGKAEAAVAGSPLPTVGGRPVVWVAGTGPGGSPVGRQAYDFNVGGRQVIIDAGSGEVLSRRDRRTF